MVLYQFKRVVAPSFGGEMVGDIAPKCAGDGRVASELKSRGEGVGSDKLE